MPEQTFIEVTATCRTEGCPNEGHSMTIPVVDEPNPAVVCGGCRQPITDLAGLPEAPVEPEPEPEGYTP